MVFTEIGFSFWRREKNNNNVILGSFCFNKRGNIYKTNGHNKKIKIKQKQHEKLMWYEMNFDR